jgi:hypothetical protein
MTYPKIRGVSAITDSFQYAVGIDDAGRTVLMSGQDSIQSVIRNPVNSGESPQRVFLLGDSLTMRAHRAVSAASFSISGTDVTVTSSSAAVPVGSYMRVINQSNASVNIDVPVVTSTSAGFTIRYPFDVTGLLTGTISGSLYGQDNDSGWWNYAAGALAVAGKPVTVVRNAGDGGDTLAQILARISTEIAPYAQPGDIVAFMGGVNGAGTGADDSLDESTEAAVVGQLELIFDALLALGVTVHASTITQAEASGYWATSPSTALAITTAANGYIRGRCLSEARMRCFDSHAALGGGSYATAGTVESAGIHFLVAGAQLVGARYVTDCGADYRKASYRRWLSVADNYADSSSWNLIGNANFAGATGSTRPTGWTSVTAGGGSNTYTLSARSDGMGNDLLFAKAHTAATTTAIGYDITAAVTAGDRLIFGCEMEGTAATETHQAKVRIDIVVGADTYSYRLQNNHFSYAQGGRGMTAGTRYFFEKVSGDNDGRNGVEVPAGFTSVTFVLEIGLGASGTASATFSRPHCYKV